MKKFSYYDEPIGKVQTYHFIKYRVFKENNYNPRINPTREDEKERKRLEDIAHKEHKKLLENAENATQEFKKDLFEELDIQDNPKRELLYNKAYDKGRSYGFREIYNIACDLVDLIL